MNSMQLNSLWDYSDPAGSAARFRAALNDAGAAANRDCRLQLLTQIARTHSLRRQFDQAHAILDDVEPQLTEDTPAASVRYLLERGRTCNSSGAKDTAMSLFHEAWESAQASQIDGLAVDAAHMIAIVAAGEEALQWNHKALELAESSDDPDARRWRGSLHNNLGWTHHDQGDYERALVHFEKALTAQIEKDDAGLVRVAKWCIGRCLRSLGRIEEALTTQRELKTKTNALDEPDGFICEELGECLHALGRTDEARPYFKRAYDVLSKDAWLMESEPQRIERLRTMSEGVQCLDS